MPPRPLTALLATACALVATHAVAQTTAPTRDLFDPERHMRVSEVKPGMKGFGKTVLSGSKIETFEVEVISVLHNSFGPQQDAVMIRCLDPQMQHFGPIAGCSGSPIYLYDDAGNARLVGAYAFGFDFAKDPIVGVQPIEYMLTLHKPPAGVDDTGTHSPMTWSLLDANVIPALAKPAAAPTMTSAPHAARLRPLTVPLAISGLSESAIASLRPLLAENGFEPMLAPGAASQPSDESIAIEPGSVLGAAVLSGDLELTAIGTCTEVIDGRAYGFGHPFNGEGATSIPMGPGTVNLVMPTLTNSFKIGGISQVTGAIDMDGTYGIAGEIGASATTIPIRVEIRDIERDQSRTFNYRAALHRSFTPMMVGAALQSSITAESELPVEHTVRYDATLTFKGGGELKFKNVVTSLEGFSLARQAAWPIAVLMNNPFGNLPVENVTATVHIERGVRSAEIESASAAPGVFRPGETVPIRVRLRQYKGEAFTRSIDFKLPDTLADGEYMLSIGDADANFQQIAQLEAHRFAVRSLDELLSTMQTMSNAQSSDRLYVRLVGTDQGIAIGRTELRKLPMSRNAILQSAGRPDTAAATGSIVVETEMQQTVTGRSQVSIQVKRKLP